MNKDIGILVLPSWLSGLVTISIGSIIVIANMMIAWSKQTEITSHSDGDVVNGTIEIRGSVTDENPHH